MFRKSVDFPPNLVTLVRIVGIAEQSNGLRRVSKSQVRIPFVALKIFFHNNCEGHLTGR